VRGAHGKRLPEARRLAKDPAARHAEVGQHEDGSHGDHARAFV
jgi:hypothetical protein